MYHERPSWELIWGKEVKGFRRSSIGKATIYLLLFGGKNIQTFCVTRGRKEHLRNGNFVEIRMPAQAKGFATVIKSKVMFGRKGQASGSRVSHSSRKTDSSSFHIPSIQNIRIWSTVL